MRIGRTIYLDHQATTPVDPRVLAAMMPHFEAGFANPHSSDHILGWQAAQTADQAAAKVAKLVGGDADEIIFTSGATESNNLALLGLGHREAGGRRRRILVSAIEHKCVLAAGRALTERYGYKVELLPVDSEGRLRLSALEQTLDDDVLLVSIMAVNNECGTIQDIERISHMVRAYEAYVHCDAAQAPCAIDLTAFSTLVDLLSLSAHKMYGPKGIGALFIRRELHGRIEPLIYGGGQQNNLRSGTVPVPLCVGMGEAADLFLTDEALAQRDLIRHRRDCFIQKLLDIPWPISLNGPETEVRHPYNANFRFCGLSAHDILGVLQPHVAASTGAACTSGVPEPSHVLRAIGLSTNDAEASIRFSLGRGTSDQDIEDAVIFIGKALTRLAGTELI